MPEAIVRYIPNVGARFSASLPWFSMPDDAAGETMYHYDPRTALEELQEDALLPHPVKLRDMILRIKLQPKEAQAMNQEFQDYLNRFGEIQRVARGILEKLANGKPKSA
jgi:hypothetical protein